VEAVHGKEFMRESLDGRLNGIGQQVVDGEADLCIALSNLLPYRRKWLNFLQPVLSDR
jgi:hypothetical protein